MKLIVMCGLPGSFKTTTANQLAEEAKASGKTAIVCSADDHFIVNGKYIWKAEEIYRAHKACKEKAAAACKDKVDLVIIDNTSLSPKERKPYKILAEELGYQYEVKIVGEFTEDFAKLCAARNTHAVPEKTILKMAASMRSRLAQGIAADG